MKFHEASKLFPLLEGDDFKSFAADIKENGLQNPIKTFHGEILDGRNRYRACKEVGVKPEYEEVSPDDPVSYVLSLNLHHRHLNEAQRAMVAARVRPHFEKLAKERQEAGKSADGQAGGRGHKKTLGPIGPKVLRELKSRASEEAGMALNVSRRSVDRARVVQGEGVPELAKKVEAGEMSLSKAAKIATLSSEDQVKALNGEKVELPVKGSGGCPVKGHEKTEQYALECARVAITQLARIKPNNPGRDKAFTKVEKWITKQRENK
ncbi:MAG: ParB/RepB/Spo0J family partition protein [Methylococcaceae bacterium]|nr:ParB/RepB/Spo0J family partition protein [Methylococcaceae bacterium]